MPWNLDESLLYLPIRPDVVEEVEYKRRWMICHRCEYRDNDHCMKNCLGDCSLQFRMKFVFHPCPEERW